MATPENTGLPRREARAGGALDAEIQQQVADLNLRGIEVIRQRLAASQEVIAGERRADGGGEVPPGAVPAAQPAAPRRRSPARLAGSPGGQLALARGRPGHAPGLATPSDPALPAALQRLAGAWLGLDAAALQRVAACPYLLFELDLAGLLGSAMVAPRSVQESHGAAAPAPVTPFSAGEGRRFARLLFHYEWYLVRSAPACAAFALGAPAASLEPLRALGLARVEELAGSARHFVRLRWDDDPLFWGDWLEAARRGEPAVLWASQLRGLQRIAGACRDMPASS